MSVQPALTTELIILRQAWQQALRALLLSPGQTAIGRVRRSRSSGSLEMLVEDFELADHPQGADWPPLADWCLLATGSGEQVDPRWWIQRVMPRRSQWLAVVVIGGATPGASESQVTCRTAVFDQGAIVPLSGMRIIGGQMLHLTDLDAIQQEMGHTLPSLRGDGPTTQETEGRWSRTSGAVGRSVMSKLRSSCVTIVGAGRNGSLLAWQLAALGVGQLRIIDGDHLHLANLDAMVGLKTADVGRPKVEVLAERLLEFQPALALTVLPRSVADERSLELLRRRTDLLATCVDSDVARLAVSTVARDTLTVHLDVGTSVQRTGDSRQISADARLLLPAEGCVACVGPMPNLDDVLYDLAAPVGALTRGRRAAWFEERAGSLITINSMAVGAAVQSWLELLAGELNTSFWQRFSWLGGAGLRSDAAEVGAADMCAFCHRFPSRT